MTLHRRILTFYTATLLAALVVITFWSWFEFDEQREIVLNGGIEAVEKESPLLETLEITLLGGVPALAIALIGGHLLMRRALRPIEQFTEELEQTDVTTLERPVSRSGNGDELDRMAAVFNGMKERLGASFTQAREFTLHASHELKTPLTILHSTLEQMLARPAESASQQQERIASMLEEVQRLSGIVGQLAFLARADAGQLETTMADVRLHELVKDLADDLALLSAASSINVVQEKGDDVIVAGDRMRLRQLLVILGDNAVKHNVPGGSITLLLHHVGAHACFRIINTGRILAPELRSRIFERFFRGDPSHSSSVEGCGLGLSIAQSIVRSHQGRLEFAVLTDDRTQLTLWLPLGGSGGSKE